MQPAKGRSIPMTRSLSIPCLLPLALLLSSVSSCSQSTAMPGTGLGTFAISATRTADTCGSGIASEASWKFDIELSVDDSQLYWRQDDATVSAYLNASNEATFEGSMTSTLEPDAGAAACVVTRTDSTVIKLDAKTDTKAVSGTISFSYAAEPGRDCSRQLASAGGSFAALPCALSYSFTGVRTKAP